MKDFSNELSQKVIKNLEENKYARGTIERYSSILDQVVRYSQGKGESAYKPELGQMYLEEKKKCLTTKSLDDYTAVIRQLDDVYFDRTFEAVHREKAVFNPPAIFAEAYQGYVDFRKSKGLAEETLDKDRRYACDFLNDLVERECLSFGDIEPRLIIELVDLRVGGYQTTLRHFLAYLFETKQAPYDYSVFVTLCHKQYRLPPVYTKEEQLKIQDVLVKNEKVAKRNKAIFLLSTRYGFRDGNIAGLKFENVNFENDRITIDQVKTGIRKSYPLYLEVKEALLDYIQNERPSCNIDYIFVTSTAPYRKMTAIYALFYSAIEAAGINTNGRTMGSHSVGRASLATEMINNGMSYELVREALGQTSENVINRYASLDVEKLRICAQSVNTAGGFFERFLNGEETL